VAIAHHDPTVVLMSTGALGAAGGVAVVGGMPGSPWFEALAREAFEMQVYAERVRGKSVSEGRPRSRLPGRALASSPGGPVQDAFYADPGLCQFISEQVGISVVPSGNRGSYTYYAEPGDHLDLHVDVDGCDVTLITVLHDSTDVSRSDAGVAVYRSAIGQPLESIDIRGDHGTGHEAAVVKARAGDSILILGGLVPHRVLPLGSSGIRVISPLCFRAHLPITGPGSRAPASDDSCST